MKKEAPQPARKEGPDRKMGRYITLSAFLHALAFALLWLPSMIWLEAKPNTIAVVPIPPSRPEPTPEEQATPTPVPTPDLTNVRSIVGEEMPTPTPSPTPTHTATKKPTKTPTPTVTPEEPTATPTKTEEPPTLTPTEKPPTRTPTKAPTETPKATNTQKATATPTPDLKKTAVAEALRNLATQMVSPEEEDATPVPVEPARVSPPDGREFTHGQAGGVKTKQDFGDQAYLLRLSQQLRQNFRPPRVTKEGGARVAVVYFRILQSGELTDVQLLESSGHRRVDSAALYAAHALGQFEPLPGRYDDLEVTCDFKVE